MSSPDQLSPKPCNICGSERFGPGPMGRLSSTGKPPACHTCGALERHRALRAVLERLPLGLFYHANALVFSKDSALEPRWFHSFERSIYGEQNSLDLQAIARPDGLYDFLSLNHVLEFVPDADTAFRELVRVCSPAGIIQIGFSNATTRPACLHYDEPHGVQGCFHLFGADLPAYFGLADLGIQGCITQGLDTATGVTESFYLFTRSNDVFAMLEAAGGKPLPRTTTPEQAPYSAEPIAV